MVVQVIILAAGQGKRMVSRTSKMLHPLARKPLLKHIIETVTEVSNTPAPIIIYGHDGDAVRAAFQHENLQWVEQKQQLGTGHAVMQALPLLNDHDSDHDSVLILCGDVPLISAQTLKQLIATTPKNAIGMLTAQLSQPEGYGRIIRDAQQHITNIIEEKDASEKERAITEINPGIYFIPTTFLKKSLPKLNNQNKQHEYYLTEMIAHAVKDKITIHTMMPAHIEEILGVNDRVQLAHLERFYQRQAAEKLMHAGVTIIDPARIDIRGDVQIAADVVIDIDVILIGKVVIGAGCVIGPHVILQDVTLSENVEVKANSMIEGATIDADCVIGPFARIRPATHLSAHVHIGNFVEIKKSDVGAHTKISHLTYIGDSRIGKNVNVGAGTITCNYDGINKHETIIGDDVHIGSDTQLIAPVKIGNGATIGAGSTVAKDVPPQQLTITHKLEQRSVKNWQRPIKTKKEKE